MRLGQARGSPDPSASAKGVAEAQLALMKKPCPEIVVIYIFIVAMDLI